MIVSLQVQKIPSKRICFGPLPEKISQPASLTVEAAFSSTLFFMFMLTILFPLHFIGTYEHIQAAMEKVGKDIAVYAYTEDGYGMVDEAVRQSLVRKKMMDELGREWR